MHFTHTSACLLAAGSLTVTLGLPVSTSENLCISTIPTTLAESLPNLAPRQEWGWAPASSVPTYGAYSPPIPTFVYTPQPSAVVPSVSYSYTNVPTATAPAEAQENNIYNAPRDTFGTRAMLTVFGVVGAVVLVIAVWAIIAHRNGRRPCACFGGCFGRKKDSRISRGGSMDSDIPLTGAGRHFDRRPVSMQPQPVPMAAPQRPKPAQHQVPRQPMPDAEWASVFKGTK